MHASACSGAVAVTGTCVQRSSAMRNNRKVAVRTTRISARSDVAENSPAGDGMVVPEAVRLGVVGSESLGAAGHWMRLVSNADLSEHEWDEVKAHLQGVYRSALRKNLAKIGLFLDDNDEIVEASPEFLDGLDLTRIPPGAEDDLETARHIAKLRALKERHANAPASATAADDVATIAHESADERVDDRGDVDVTAAGSSPDAASTPSSLTWVPAPERRVRRRRLISPACAPPSSTSSRTPQPRRSGG